MAIGSPLFKGRFGGRPGSTLKPRRPAPPIPPLSWILGGNWESPFQGEIWRPSGVCSKTASDVPGKNMEQNSLDLFSINGSRLSCICNNDRLSRSLALARRLSPRFFKSNEILPAMKFSPTKKRTSDEKSRSLLRKLPKKRTSDAIPLVVGH